MREQRKTSGLNSIRLSDLRSDDPQIVGEAYRRAMPDMIHIAKGVVRDHEAEDVAQEAFLNVFTRLNESDAVQDRSIGGYLATSTKRQGIDYVRHRNVIRRKVGEQVGYKDDLAEGAEAESTEKSAANAIEEERLLSRIRSVIEHDDWADAVILRDYCGLSYQAVADLLGVKVGTIRSRLYRGRERLIARIDEVVEDPQETLPKVIYEKKRGKQRGSSS